MGSRDRVAAAGLTVLSLLLAGPGQALPLHAQEPSSVPFRIPPADALPGLVSGAVIDTPATPPDTVDLTPVIDAAAAAVDALPASDWDVTALAASLSGTDAAFQLVRDSIRLDAYRGLLRGAGGTLSARAGNAFDRASLLRALLDAQGATTRFAFGTLDDATASTLLDHTFDTPNGSLPQATVSLIDPAFEAAIDGRAGRDMALLSGALGDRLLGLDADAAAAAAADLRDHAWVQLLQPDGTWLDLDPSLPDSQPGQALTSAQATADTMPDTAVQTVTLRVIAEALQDGQLQETTALEAALPAWAAADQQILIAFVPAAGSGGLLGNPGGLLGGGGDGAGYMPVLLIDDVAFHGDPILVAGEAGGGGLLGPGTPFDLASISLEIETDVPGSVPTVSRHVIADRLSTEQRHSGVATPDDLLPVTDAAGTPSVFSTILHVMLSTGGSDPRAYAAAQGFAAQMAAWGANTPDTSGVLLDRALAPAATADQMLVMASERLIIPAVDDDQVRAYAATPRVYVAARALDPTDPSLHVMETDLVSDAIRTLARPGAPADAAARHQLWYGALQGALETEYGLSNAGSFDPDGLQLQGVSFDMGKPLTVVSGTGGVSPSAADDDLAALLAAGGVAVVPGDPSAATTWWQVGPDGATRSILAPRLGGLGILGRLFSPLFRIQPTLPSQPGGNGKGGRGGTEYQNSLEPSKQATPTVQAASEAAKDSFQQTAGSIARDWARFQGK